MSPIRPPSSGGVTRTAGPLAPSAWPYGVRSIPSPALRILVAGVDQDERRSVETSIRDALGPRTDEESLSVSIVRLAGKWSVTLDGAGDRLRGVSFIADSGRLVDAIREAVLPGRDAQVARSEVPEAACVPPTEARDEHVCEHCGKVVLVVYDRRPGEPKEMAPLACPHCWRIGHVEIGVWAAVGRDYRAEKG